MPPKKPSKSEEEFVARQEAKDLELRRLKREQAAAEAARQERWRTCPGGCETKLKEEAFRDIMIDRCPTCGGVWLDPGELEKLSGQDSSLVQHFFDSVFRGGRSS
jgi:hypothetical protein